MKVKHKYHYDGPIYNINDEIDCYNFKVDKIEAETLDKALNKVEISYKSDEHKPYTFKYYGLVDYLFPGWVEKKKEQRPILPKNVKFFNEYKGYSIYYSNETGYFYIGGVEGNFASESEAVEYINDNL